MSMVDTRRKKKIEAMENISKEEFNKNNVTVEAGGERDFSLDYDVEVQDTNVETEIEDSSSLDTSYLGLTDKSEEERMLEEINKKAKGDLNTPIDIFAKKIETETETINPEQKIIETIPQKTKKTEKKETGATQGNKENLTGTSSVPVRTMVQKDVELQIKKVSEGIEGESAKTLTVMDVVNDYTRKLPKGMSKEEITHLRLRKVAEETFRRHSHYRNLRVTKEEMEDVVDYILDAKVDEVDSYIHYLKGLRAGKAKDLHRHEAVLGQLVESFQTHRKKFEEQLVKQEKSTDSLYHFATKAALLSGGAQKSPMIQPDKIPVIPQQTSKALVIKERGTASQTMEPVVKKDIQGGKDKGKLDDLKAADDTDDDVSDQDNEESEAIMLAKKKSLGYKPVVEMMEISDSEEDEGTKKAFEDWKVDDFFDCLGISSYEAAIILKCDIKEIDESKFMSEFMLIKPEEWMKALESSSVRAALRKRVTTTLVNKYRSTAAATTSKKRTK